MILFVLFGKKKVRENNVGNEFAGFIIILDKLGGEVFHIFAIREVKWRPKAYPSFAHKFSPIVPFYAQVCRSSVRLGPG